MDKTNIPKAYDAKQVEDKIYSAWEKSGLFNPDNAPDRDKRKESFSIVLPLPNVTGTLHLGHAAMLAIEDIMTRYARLQGKDTLWIPGTDHAAIATQTKVEKLLMKEGMEDPRKELGREKFLQRVDKFAQESHDTIVNQVRKMGASIDWSREAFTLDETRTTAVLTVFKKMYDDGLIYRGHRIVNWCPRCHSTLADDEVEYKEAQGKMYTFKYSHDFPFTIASTRPETKLGDTAVAVHPDDKRYKEFVGQEIETEFCGQPIKLKIIADKAVDPELGTGALGVTPAHSHIDADMAAQHDLETVQVIDEDGNIVQGMKVFAGMAAEKAREQIVQYLEEQGLMEKIEDAPHNLSLCYRCDSVIEPIPSHQWFINVNKEFAFKLSKSHPIDGLKDGDKVTLKKLMQHVVRKNQIEIIPDRFNKTYFHWIDNLRDWCISRQIWYGHRIPVWYRGEETYVGIEEPEGEGSSSAKASEDKWEQDPDTLDTWFSSGLWTFSTLGWPEETEDMKRYHPTAMLETGYDILFFWVARMILMTTYNLGEIPFKQVYLHGLVRDEKGRKMSKSLGNVIDPLDVIPKYGTDAVRLSLVIGTSPGNDTKLSEEKIAGYRNFTNKLWNISRFVLTSVTKVSSVEKVSGVTLADKWILSRFGQVVDEVTAKLDKHEFSQAGELLRDFTWNEFADWYLEIAKIQRKDQETKVSTDRILLYILERVLVMWHPFMPFVTEEIWKMFGSDEFMMMHAWPKVSNNQDKESETKFELLREVVSSIRNLRAEYRVDPGQKIPVHLVSKKDKVFLEEQIETIRILARVTPVHVETDLEKPEGAVSAVVGQVQIYLPLAGIIDVDKEKTRLAKELEGAEQYLESLEKRLANKSFVAKAPEKMVSDIKQKKVDAEEKVQRIKKQLASL